MRIFVVVAALVGVGAVVWAAAVARGLVTPADPGAAPSVFEVAKGEPLVGVARRLARTGLVRDSRVLGVHTLVWYARARGLDRRVKSGEYELSAAMTPLEILTRIVDGTVKTYPVTLPPGLHTREIAERLEAAGIVKAVRFVQSAVDPELARALGIEAGALEGYLFPETYRFRRDTPAEEVVRSMVSEFHAGWTEADRERLAANRWSLHQVVTLASIVEKETATPEERARIAAVFGNRLERNMRLQSDPTVIYGVLITRGSFDGNIKRRDLQTDTPYNTYTRGGLPPGPIANPGMASIRAVLEPEDADYLYFVSRNDGTHQFSSNHQDHINAVNRYQKGGRRRTDG